MKTAIAKKQKSRADVDDEPTLQLTMDQYRQLEQIYYAIGELADMIDPPGSVGGGLQCLEIVNISLGKVVHELQALEKATAEEAKGGGK